MRALTFPDRALRSVGIAALLVSIGVGMTSSVLFLAAFQVRLDWFLEPAALVSAGPTSAELLRWAAVLDLVGYYLAAGVLAYVLWRLLRPRNALVADLATLAALLGFAIGRDVALGDVFRIGRDVVLGLVFALWTAWWIWLLVLFRASSRAGRSPGRPAAAE